MEQVIERHYRVRKKDADKAERGRTGNAKFGEKYDG